MCVCCGGSDGTVHCVVVDVCAVWLLTCVL